MSYESRSVVNFAVEGEPRKFKFNATVADEKLRLWVEDTVTKRQWQTKDLAVLDFVTIDTAIPQFKAKDYAVRIVECIAPSESVKHDISQSGQQPASSLSKPGPDGRRVLFVAFAVQVLTAAVTLEYTFTLDEIALERVDLLEARIADLETPCSRRGDDMEAQKRVFAQELENVTNAFKQELKSVTEALNGKILQLENHLLQQKTARKQIYVQAAVQEKATNGTMATGSTATEVEV